MPLISHTWGTTPAERQLAYPCDELISNPTDTLFRGVTIEAPASVIFRWLCQLRVAPYSYDLIDNGGKQSPQQLTPDLEQLSVGHDIMTIFTLVSFARNDHLTIRIKQGSRAIRTFGDIAGSYVIVPREDGHCRLLVKLLVRHARGFRGELMHQFLPWGDLIMMRRQLLNLKKLSEQDSNLLNRRDSRD